LVKTCCSSYNYISEMDSRRDFIKKAALLTGAVGLADFLPASVQKALAIDPVLGSTYMDAEHIVILMQENRSFDHCFGNLKGVRGYNDPRAIDLPNKNKVWLQSNAAGETYCPFRLNIKDTKATWMSYLPHSRESQINAWNDGKFDKWLDSKRSDYKEFENLPLTMGYYNREDIPFYYAFADAFTVCDQHFCSSLTGTNPNRLYFWTGTIREQQNAASRALLDNGESEFMDLHMDSFPERLQDNGISWKVYQNELSSDLNFDVGLNDEEDDWLANFSDNPLAYLANYNVRMHKTNIDNFSKLEAQLTGEIASLEKKVQANPDKKLQKQLDSKKADLALVQQDKVNFTREKFDKLSEKEKAIHQKAFVTNVNDPQYRDLTPLSYDDDGTPRTLNVPKGDVLHQFREDVKTGALPMVSWLVAPENFSDHPAAPWYGAWYVSETLDILTQDPEVWKKTIFILTYDENDGYFDHVPPFVPPHPDKPATGKVSAGLDTQVDYIVSNDHLKYDSQGPVGLGYRVPMVIASPWSKGGWVNSEVFDHTSTLQFLEDFLSKKTGKPIRETNISDWRRAICGNLTSAFRPYKEEKNPTPEFLQKNEVVESIYNAKFKKLPDGFKLLTADEMSQLNHFPAASPYMPQQEKGIKPSCGLRYELYADGKLSADKKSFALKLSAGNEVFGKSAKGSPFNVYLPGKDSGAFNRAYTVVAGDTLADTWLLSDFENSNYHLAVHGPNGFFREFKGNAADPDIDITLAYQRSVTDRKKLTGNVELHLHNLKTDKHFIEITDHAYKTNTQKKVLNAGDRSVMVLNLVNSYGWYDFSIKVSGNNAFEKRYAGRVDTGKASFSDPQMG
jgi:phospholipase C